MVQLTEEDEVFANTMPRMMTAEERRLQRQYYLAEDEWRTCDKFIFFPVERIKQIWDFVIITLVAYACTVMPYRAFFEEASGAWFVFETIMNFIFLFDVCLSFNTAYLEGEVWVVHRPRIRRNYMRFWFWIDFPSAIPVELILTLLDIEGSAATRLLPVARLLRLFRLLRMLRLLRIGEFITKLEDETGYSLSSLRLLNTVAILLIFCHVLACIFYAVAIATQDEVPKTWVTFFDGGYMLEPDTPVFDAYLISFFWAIGLVCGQNTNITAESMPDRILSIVVYLLATLFFAYIIAVVTDQLQEYINDPRNKAMGELQLFCRFHGVTEAPNNLELRLRSYFANYYQNRSMIDDAGMIAKLTPSLKDEVMDHLLFKTVRICPLLHPPDVEEERVQKFQEAIYDVIVPVSFEAKDLILSKNAHSEDLYFLRRGQVNAVFSRASGFSLEHTLFPISQVGAFFGEQCLLGEASEVNFMAACRTDVLCVPRDVLVDAAKEFLDDEMRLMFAEAVWADILHKALRRLWGMRIAFAEMVEENNERIGLAKRPRVHRLSSAVAKTTVISTYGGNKEIIAMLTQICWLQLTLKRLQKENAADMLPDIVGDARKTMTAAPKGAADDEVGMDASTLNEMLDRRLEPLERIDSRLTDLDARFTRLEALIVRGFGGTPPRGPTPPRLPPSNRGGGSNRGLPRATPPSSNRASPPARAPAPSRRNR